MKKLIFLLLLGGCGPLAPSIPKSQICSIPSEYLSRYNLITVGSSWHEVQNTMNETPMISGNTQIYVHCKNMVFKFSGSSLASKEIE